MKLCHGAARSRESRGVVLIEMVVIIALMAAFMVVIGSLFVVAYRAEVDSTRRDALLHRVDAVVDNMRRDVWGAREIAFDRGHLDLALGNKQKIRWDVTTPHQVTRTLHRDDAATDATTTWINLPAVDSVDVHGPIVTATFKETRQRESVTFISQVLLGSQP